ncbi:MAG: response regulator [Halocynthiibacter sp.]
MDNMEQFAIHSKPSAARPLVGVTVLVVEDSRYACEALRLLCLKSGARIRRADCLKSARKHLRVYRPSVAIIDVGLPDGSGAELIEELARASARVPVILGTSGDMDAKADALAAGCDAFLPKPVSSLAAFQDCILRFLPENPATYAPRLVSTETIRPDPISYRDDMILAADLLTHDTQKQSIDYVARFLRGVATSANDTPLIQAADQLLAQKSPHDIQAITGLLNERMHDHELL